MAEDLHDILRLASERAAQPTAAIYSRTLRSTPESGARGAYDGAKGKKESSCIWRSIHLVIFWRCM
jgi:hypothetical protein